MMFNIICQVQLFHLNFLKEAGMTFGGHRNDQQVVVVFLQQGKRLAKLVDLVGAHGVEVEAGHRYQLSLLAHGHGHECLLQLGRGEGEGVQLHHVEECKGGVGADQLLCLADGKGLEIVLVSEKQISRSGIDLDLLSEIRFLEQLHGSSFPLFLKKACFCIFVTVIISYEPGFCQ